MEKMITILVCKILDFIIKIPILIFGIKILSFVKKNQFYGSKRCDSCESNYEKKAFALRSQDFFKQKELQVFGELRQVFMIILKGIS